MLESQVLQGFDFFIVESLLGKTDSQLVYWFLAGMTVGDMGLYDMMHLA